LYHHGSTEQLAYLNPLEVHEVEAADVIVHVVATTNTRALTGIDPSRQAVRGKARQPLMDRFLRRAADKSLRWVVTQFPCPAAARKPRRGRSASTTRPSTAGVRCKASVSSSGPGAW